MILYLIFIFVFSFFFLLLLLLIFLFNYLFFIILIYILIHYFLNLLSEQNDLSLLQQELAYYSNFWPELEALLTAFLGLDLAKEFNLGANLLIFNEAEIGSLKAGKKSFHRFDQLILDYQQAWLIDYKSDVKIPESVSQIPQQYLRQLANYGKLIKEIYPDLTLNKILIYLNGPSWFII